MRSSCTSALRLLLLPFAVFITASFLLSTPVHAAQTVPYKVNFQGRLTNASGTVLSGTYDMSFKLYTALTGGTLIWSETRTTANGNAVTVTNGLFSVLIGEGTAVAGSSATLQAAVTANMNMYMEVTVGAETLTPRSQFGSAAYAINADMLDGYDSSYFAPATGSTAYAPISGSTNYAPISGSTNYAPISGSANYIQNQTASAQTAGFNINGNGRIGGTGTVVGAFTNNGEAMFYNSTNSAAAFTIQTSTAAKLFVADTTNSRVYIGNPTADANAVLLVLDYKNTTGDPTGVNGGEYYNSANNKFRCYEGGIWRDCVSGFGSVTKTADQAATTSSTTFQDDNTLFFAANANTTYVFDAWIPVNDSNATADLKYTFTIPASATISAMTSYFTSATAQVNCNITTSGQTCANTTYNNANHFIQVKGSVTVAGTAGQVRFRFAQNSSNGNAFPVIKKGATLSWKQSN